VLPKIDEEAVNDPENEIDAFPETPKPRPSKNELLPVSISSKSSLKNTNDEVKF